VLSAAALVAGLGVPHSSPGRSQPAAAPAAEHRAWAGHAGPCGGASALETVAGIVCVHGDDEAFERRSIYAEGHNAGATGRLRIPCGGHGRFGNRIAVYYAYIAGHPNRVANVRGLIRRAIEEANYIVYRSARQTHGRRWLRVLTTRQCRPIVHSLRLPRAAANSFGRTIDAASAAGLHATNRKYVLFVDSAAMCGVATLVYDGRPGRDNANNSGPSWARVDRGCWSGPTAAHEIFHMLGSVQRGAPHFDDTGHCTDDRDLMCYQSEGGRRVYIRCSRAVGDHRLDCGKDDYFNTSPRPDSFLARHWNTARSSFLYYGGPAMPNLPRRVPAPSVTMTSLTTARVQWSAPAYSRVTQYELMRNGVVVWHGTAANSSDTGASPGGVYQVRAVNEAGAGAWSASVRAVLPAPPAPDTVTRTSTSSVSWTADAVLVQSFELYGVLDDGSVQFISSWPATAREATDYTLWPTWNEYRVCAYNVSGSACTDATT
jgi:hypothetical protein